MSTDEPQPQIHERSGTVTAQPKASAGIKVTRGLNDTRLAILGIMVTIALTVAFGIQNVDWWGRILIGIALFVAVAVGSHFVLRSERATDRLMAFAHWTLGRKH
jgi:hypothetical protein